MSLDANEITSGIWQGRFPETREALADIDRVVMCAPLRESERETFAALLRNEDILDCPFVDDIQAPSDKELGTIMIAARAVVALAQSRSRVLVACREGKNRSGLVVALALKKLYGMSGEQALAHVQKHRPGALYNWYFQQIVLTGAMP